MIEDGREFSPGEASKHAAEWCRKHPKWQRYCDLSSEFTNRLTLSWDEIPESDRTRWKNLYAHGAQTCWEEFCSDKPERYRYGFISGEGRFYAEITDVPRFHNFMMVVQSGGKPGCYYRGGRGIPSGRPRRKAVC